MARAGDNPQAWEKLLALTWEGDWDGANKVTVKYGFDKDARGRKKYVKKAKRNVSSKRGSIYIYYAESPSGEVSQHEDGEELSIFLGISEDNVFVRFSQNRLEFKKGELEGWRIWRKLKGEDE